MSTNSLIKNAFLVPSQIEYLSHNYKVVWDNKNTMLSNAASLKVQ